MIFAFAALFRALLLPSTPIHENDFYRYLWDGKSLGHGVNPYLFPPGDVTSKADPLGTLFSNPLAERRSFADLTPDQSEALGTLIELKRQHPLLHERIGHPHIRTIYPPVSQASFWANEIIAGGSFIGWKCLVILFDLATCVVIALLLSAVGKNPSMVIVYAWSPLVIKEFANSGHHDSLPIFLTMMAIFLGVRGQRISSTIALALGTLGKFFPVALLPVLSPPSKKAPPWLRYILFATIITFAFLPFFFWQAAGFARVFSGLHTYNQGWEFFGGIFAIIHRAILWIAPDLSLYPAKIITAILFAAAVAWVTFFGSSERAGTPFDEKVLRRLRRLLSPQCLRLPLVFRLGRPLPLLLSPSRLDRPRRSSPAHLPQFSPGIRYPDSFRHLGRLPRPQLAYLGGSRICVCRTKTLFSICGTRKIRGVKAHDLNTGSLIHPRATVGHPFHNLRLKRDPQILQMFHPILVCLQIEILRPHRHEDLERRRVRPRRIGIETIPHLAPVRLAFESPVAKPSDLGVGFPRRVHPFEGTRRHLLLRRCLGSTRIR